MFERGDLTYFVARFDHEQYFVHPHWRGEVAYLSVHQTSYVEQQSDKEALYPITKELTKISWRRSGGFGRGRGI